MNYTLITGASSGIGLELAKIFARNNHNLILVARSTDKLATLKREIQSSTGAQVEIFGADLSLPNSAGELYQTVQSKNLSVDILVNNAGVGTYGEFVQTHLKATQDMIHLNITTLTELTKLFLPEMLANKSGRILNVASTASFQPGPLMTVYYATKAFVLHFSEGLFEELKDSGVTVTALCPGPTESGFQAAAKMENVALFDAVQLPTSKMVAEYGYSALMAGQAIAVHGAMNKVLSSSIGFLPRTMVRKLVMKLQKKRLS